MIQNIQRLFNIQTRNINASTVTITYYPSDGYNAMSSITVNKVTAAIDNNIQASNIRQGVVILGVTGTLVTGLCVDCDACEVCDSCQDCNDCQECDDCDYCEECDAYEDCEGWQEECGQCASDY